MQEIVRTQFINICPDRPIKCSPVYDPVAKWTCGHVAAQAASASAAKTWLYKLAIARARRV